MKERIKELMDKEDLTPSAFADKLGIGRAVMSHILNGRNNPSLDVVTRILTTLDDINSDWLITGDGPMLKSDLETPVEVKTVQVPVYTPPTDLFSKEEQIKEQTPSPIHPKTETTQQVETPQNQKIPPNPPEEQNLSQETELQQATKIKKQLDITSMPQPSSDKKRVSKIIIYYNDNTFETFEADNRPL